jgi:hypothetical protein
MKRSATPPNGQLNLGLLETPVIAAVSSEEQKELTTALVELLLHAAHRDLETRPEGGESESSKAHA